MKKGVRVLRFYFSRVALSMDLAPSLVGGLCSFTYLKLSFARVEKGGREEGRNGRTAAVTATALIFWLSLSLCLCHLHRFVVIHTLLSFSFSSSFPYYHVFSPFSYFCFTYW